MNSTSGHPQEDDLLLDEVRFRLREAGFGEAAWLEICESLHPMAAHHLDRAAESERSIAAALTEALEKLARFLAGESASSVKPTEASHLWLLASRLAQVLGQTQRAWESLGEALRLRGLQAEGLLQETADPFVIQALLSSSTLPLSVMQLRSSPADKGRLLTLAMHQKLLEVSKRLHSELDPKQLFATMMDVVIELTGAERGFLLLAEEMEDADFQVVAARNFSREDLRNPLFQLSRTVCRQAMDRGKAMRIRDAHSDRRLSHLDSVADLKLRSILCAPVRIRERIVGAIYLDHVNREDAFTEEHVEMLTIFAEQASSALENARLHKERQVQLRELQEQLRKIEHLNRRLEEELAAKTLELKDIQMQVHDSQSALHLKYNYDQIIGGASPKMKNLYKILDRITSSDSTIHIFGESGTGKELVARAIHYNGPRAKAPFVSINCSAIPDDLLESELFGHERGSFTSAVAMRRGLFELAHGGTLFLDEVGDMSTEMQVKLLRVLETGQLRRVGGQDSLIVDVRVISAANKNIQDLVVKGVFRQDLFFRLNVIMLTMPPLRERIEDLELLAKHILLDLAKHRAEKPKKITRAALNHLERYAWPGNVRELRNVLERCVVLTGREAIDYTDLPEEVITLGGVKVVKSTSSEFGDYLGLPYDQALIAFERNRIEQGLRFCHGNVLKCSQYLGMQRSTLRRKISEYVIDPKSYHE